MSVSETWQPNQEFMIKLKEEEMGDLTKIILGYTNIDELKPIMKLKPTTAKNQILQDLRGVTVSSSSSVVCSTLLNIITSNSASTLVRIVTSISWEKKNMKGTYPRHKEPQKYTSVLYVENSSLSIQICLNTEHKFI